MDALVELGGRQHAEGAYNVHPYSQERAKAFLLRTINEEQGHHVSIMAEKDSELIGGLVGYMARVFYSEDIAASALAFFVVPEWRNSLAAVKLLHGFKRWAKAGNADAVSVHVTSGVKMKETDRLLKRLGFEMVGGNYASYWIDK